MLVACGINQQAPLSLREKILFSDQTLGSPLRHLVQHTDTHEAVILTTCNRTELYCVSENHHQLLSWLTKWHNINLREINQYFYAYKAREALKHLFRVASGLDSVILGEPQILGQIKTAYKAANESGTLGSRLEEIFQQVFRVSKLIRSNTEISKHTVSLATTAINLAQRVIPVNIDSKFLLIGSGEIIESLASHFNSRGSRQFYIANRTREKAETIAKQFNGQALAIDELYSKLNEVDVVISATACPLTILDHSCVLRAMEKRNQRPLVLIDLAVPRDIDPTVSRISNVHLFDMDDCQDLSSQGLEKRRQAVLVADHIIKRELDQFELQYYARRAGHKIRHMRSQIEEMRDRELERAMYELKQGLDPAEVLKKMAHRLTNKVLHEPSKDLRTQFSNRNEKLFVTED